MDWEGTESAELTSEFDRDDLRVECLRNVPGTKQQAVSPEVISSRLPVLAKRRNIRMIVFGESTAHYICKVWLTG